MIKLDVRVLMALVTGKSRPQDALPQLGCARNMDGPAVQRCPFALLSGKHFITRGIVNHSGGQLAAMFQAHGDAEYGITMSKVRGSIERIDIPAIFAARACQRSLFSQNIVVRPRRMQPLYQQLLRLTVG